jgi:hypothetical protein
MAAMNRFFDLRVACALAASALVLATACSSAPPIEGDDLGNDDSNVLGGKGASSSGSSGTTLGGSSGSSGSESSSGAGASSSGGATSSGGTSSGGSSSGATPAGGGECASSADIDACYDCCITPHEAGYDVADQAFGDCACASPGVCAAQCATSYCAGQEPTAACEACLDAATQCDQAADTACAGNADCQAITTCIQSSACDSKP